VPREKHTELVPSDRHSTGHWSAFISADLAAIFDIEPWLDMPPNMDQQADILSKLQSIKPDQLSTVLAALDSKTEREVEETAGPSADMGSASDEMNDGESPEIASMSPQEFLLQVMRDIRLHCNIGSKLQRHCCLTKRSRLPRGLPAAKVCSSFYESVIEGGFCIVRSSNMSQLLIRP